MIREDNFWQIKTHKKFLWFNIKTSFFKYTYKVLKNTIWIIMKNNEDLNIKIAQNDWKYILLISPKVWNYEYFDFHKYEEIINIWYNEIKDNFILN